MLAGAVALKSLKRGDLVVEEIKRWIVSRELAPGDKLPKEGELQALFGVSKGTVREALKSLEVQGFVTVSTGPTGGATVVEVPLDRTVQLVQNYLFFQDVDVDAIYAVRRLLEPELAAGAVAHLTDQQIAQLESSIESCVPGPATIDEAVEQRQQDLHFHDILAAANPNSFLRFICQLINQMLRRLVVFDANPMHIQNSELGRTNVAAHRAILKAVKARDAAKVRRLMLAHIVEAEGHVRLLHGQLESRLVLDSDMRIRLSGRARD